MEAGPGGDPSPGRGGWSGWRRRSRAPGAPLAALEALPVLPRSTPLADVELIALDVETTGLQPRRDELLSLGLVPVGRGEVRLGGARHLPVRPRRSVGQSAVVHGLTDDALAAAPPLAQVLPEVLHAFAGASHRRVLLAHFSQVETTFLSAACRSLLGGPLRLQVVDTLEMQRRLLRAQHHELPRGTLRLDACRRAHGLPRYAAHLATTDAVACAELFLAQCAELEVRRGRPLTLDDVAERGLSR